MFPIRACVAWLTLVLLAGCLQPAQETAGRVAKPSPSPGPSPTPTPSPSPSGKLRIHYANVGQGDGTVWELPGGGAVVYDCGPAAADTASNAVNAAVAAMGLAPGAHVAALVASHGHLDHVGGCEQVFGAYVVDHVYESWYTGSDAPASYERFRDEVRAEGATLHVAAEAADVAGEQVFHAGDPLALPAAASTAGVRAEIVWPLAPDTTSWDAIADHSIATRLTFGNVSFCFQGDITASQEKTLAARAGDPRCDVYLAGHHGSREASSAAWLAAMQPKIAIVSVGENSYGHPTSEALCRIQQAGAKVYVTQRLGAITVETDGTSLVVSPATPESKDYCAAGAEYGS